MLLLRVVRPGGGNLFRLFGELDASNVGDLDTVVRHARGGSDVILDLAELTFVDSSGIKGLIDIARALDTGVKLILLSPRPAVARVLEVTDVVHALDNIVVFPTHDPSRYATERRGGREPRRRPARSSSGPAVVPLERPAVVATPPRGGERGTEADDLPFIWLG